VRACARVYVTMCVILLTMFYLCYKHTHFKGPKCS